MDSREHLPIKRIIKKRLEVNGIENYYLFFKNHSPKPLSASIILNEKKTILCTPLHTPIDLKKKLHKLLCQIKPIQRLDLTLSIANPYRKIHSLNKILQQIKKCKNIKQLGLPYQFPPEYFTKVSTLWLKHAKLLKKLETPLVKNDLSRLFFRYLKGTRLETLIFDYRQFHVIPEHYYPSTLKRVGGFSNLDIFIGKTSKNFEVNPSFQNLEEFHLHYPTSESFVNSVLSLSKLRSLTIQFPDTIKSISSLPLLRNLKFLEHLYLDFQSSKHGIEEFFHTISSLSQLKTFSFKQIMQLDISLKCLIACLSGWKKLEKLELSLQDDWSVTQKPFVEEILLEIGKLSQLKVLKLELLETMWCNDNTFKISLVNLIDKFKHLTELGFNSDKVYPAAMIDLLKIGQNNPNLEKIRISLGDCEVPKETCKELSKLVMSLEMIQILEFPSLNIMDKKPLKELTDSLLTRKYLRKVQLGFLAPKISQKILLKSLMNIFSIKGLEKFDFNLKKFIFRKNRMLEVVRLKEFLNKIKKNNPAINLSGPFYLITGVNSYHLYLHWLDYNF